MATKKIPLFFTYSEYISDEERVSKSRALEQRLEFSFNSHSKILEELPQRKEYETIAEIFNNTFHTDLERVKYPVFFFDDSLDQVKSMYSSAKRVFEDNPQMYFRAFYILDDSLWDNALTEIMPIIRQHVPSKRPSGGKRTRKNKTKVKKSRKHLHR